MSQRADIDTRYNQHIINGYSPEKAWDMAVTSVGGGKFDHYKLIPGTDERDAQIVTTSLYDKEQADIKKYQDDYNEWLETDNSSAINDANAKTTSSTTSWDDVQDTSTVTRSMGGGYTERIGAKVEYTDTNESKAWRAKANTLSEQENALKEKLKAQGLSAGERINHPDVRKLANERKAAELAEERTKQRTVIQPATTKQYDANGNEIGDGAAISTYSLDAETGTEAQNITTGKPQKVITEAVSDVEAVPVASKPKTERDTFVSTGSTQDEANQAANDALDAQYEADQLLESGDMEAYKVAQAKADQLTSKATELQADADFEADDALDTEMMQADFDAENLDDEYASRPEPSVSELRGAGTSKDDWRVRLRLAPQSDYLYNAPNPGILAPLAETDGIIFPYVPGIDTVHQARYSDYNLPHSNYRGYFYAGSHQERVIVSATFTAQDTKEANYMLAALHFLRSCTKMFYGQDMQRGTPPPLVFLSGLGDHQFNEHPCAVEIVNINLPNDVDYIKAGDAEARSGDFMSPLNSPRTSPAPSFGGALSRLFGSGMSFGGTPAPTYTSENIYKAESEGTTRMPTKMDINFNLIPIQTRDQVSNEYSLKNYASGSLLKKGFW